MKNMEQKTIGLMIMIGQLLAADVQILLFKAQPCIFARLRFKKQLPVAQ